MYHGLISGFTKLALDIENIMKANDNVLPSYDKYAELVLEVESYIASIKSGMKQSSLGHFTSPPHSYSLFHVEKDNQDTGKGKRPKGEEHGDNKHHRSDDTGYIVYSGSSLAKANLPKLHDGKVLCKEYVICGRNCSQRNNCRWGLHLQYRDLVPDDKEKLDHWIANSRTLKWRG